MATCDKCNKVTEQVDPMWKWTTKDGKIVCTDRKPSNEPCRACGSMANSISDLAYGCEPVQVYVCWACQYSVSTPKIAIKS